MCSAAQLRLGPHVFLFSQLRTEINDRSIVTALGTLSQEKEGYKRWLSNEIYYSPEVY